MSKVLVNKSLRFLNSFFLSAFVGFVPLVSLWSNNLGQVTALAVKTSFLITVLFVIFNFLAWLIAVRNPEKAALLSCTTSVFVFSYGHLLNLVGDFVIFGITLGTIKLLGIVLSFYVFFCIKLLKYNPGPNFRYMVMLPLFLILINGIPIIVYHAQNPNLKAQIHNEQVIESSTHVMPDIYYIVLDAYARDDILLDVIGFDNSPFLQALRDRGFYLPECAFSNYDGTNSTLMSVLNYEMLETQGIPTNILAERLSLNTQLIHANKASETFRAYGYKFVTGRGYAAFNDITSSDWYINYVEDNGIIDDLAEKRFTSLYLQTTMFRLLVELYENNPEKFSSLPYWLAAEGEDDPSLTEANFWYLQNNYMFDTLEEIPEEPGNYFVYAHINAPHGPYVYRRDGSFRYPLDDEEERVRYADAIYYINQRILKIVDTLQKYSTPQPIIIIQGDHGIHGLTSGLDKHKILSAYYLPGNLTTSPYDTITPVNNFRLILRNYFDPTIELLPDELWVKRINDYELIPVSCSLVP